MKTLFHFVLSRLINICTHEARSHSSVIKTPEPAHHPKASKPQQGIQMTIAPKKKTDAVHAEQEWL